MMNNATKLNQYPIPNLPSPSVKFIQNRPLQTRNPIASGMPKSTNMWERPLFQNCLQGVPEIQQ